MVQHYRIVRENMIDSDQVPHLSKQTLGLGMEHSSKSLPSHVFNTRESAEIDSATIQI